MIGGRGAGGRRLAVTLTGALLAGCAAPGPDSAPGRSPGPLLLQPRVATEVELVTRGRPRPQYRAAGVAGEPMPYEDSVSGGLVLCAGLGPLFGPCAGVMIGSLAVAGVTTTLIDGLASAESGAPDAASAAASLAPEATLAATLGARVAAGAFETLRGDGHEVALLPAGASGGCDLAVEPARAARHADVEVVALELEFEPGYLYRLAVVVEVRVADCGDRGRRAERRLAWRGEPRLLSRDAAAARGTFAAELDAAAAGLAKSVAAHLTAAGG